MGGLVVLPLLFVAVTGVLLNHTAELGWDEKRTEADWVLDSYGMQLAGEPVSYEASPGNFASSWNDHLFWNGNAIDARGALVGSASLNGSFVVILDTSIVLLGEDGSLIETLGEESLPPPPIHRAGLSGSGAPGLVVESGEGAVYEFSNDMLSFELSTESPESLAWRKPSPTSPALKKKIEESYRGQGVPWSRVLLDMHSGKLFGPAGRWIADIVVVLFIVLSLTGLRLIFRARRPAGSNQRRQAS